MPIIRRFECPEHGDLLREQRSVDAYRLDCVGCVDPAIREYVGVVEFREATAEVDRLRRLIGEAYVRRGSRSTQVLRELFGDSRGGSAA